MQRLVVASEAIASGRLTRRELTRDYSRVYRNVYVPTGTTLSAAERAKAAWLSSGRDAVMCGLSAAALLGSRWIPDDAPADVLGRHHRRDDGIVVHAERVPAEELVWCQGVRCTDVERTVFDLGRRLLFPENLIRVDALLNATGVPVEGIAGIADRYRGARNIRRLDEVLRLADGGAESPQESRVRIVLIEGGLPRPATQIRVGRRRVDMGWPEWKVGVEYDGAQHWTDIDQHGGDIARLEYLHQMDWVIVRVVAAHLRDPQLIIERVVAALRAKGWQGSLAPVQIGPAVQSPKRGW
ncbi:hypothetical protein [Mycolicibacterium confluentis]|uniref:Uncharacterized protein n=1 Tax=Mycolicibacterium confluentis TaxID=28047 RepID=A0A7I7XUH3_9MYCO|nr:hypothetical protein [Mycolicibacterium confluentis]MCV7322196.1 hypothetical protein [Mycolicibacterium confluentis]ORV31486.1 hypothetical protein AWB99_11850 [Mycolicibacterium confluentis]BBZ32908.1 hypothetical protein MCNF_15130 [Mycolicibacterium confluentis]